MWGGVRLSRAAVEELVEVHPDYAATRGAACSASVSPRPEAPRRRAAGLRGSALSPAAGTRQVLAVHSPGNRVNGRGGCTDGSSWPLRGSVHSGHVLRHPRSSERAHGPCLVGPAGCGRQTGHTLAHSLVTRGGVQSAACSEEHEQCISIERDGTGARRQVTCEQRPPRGLCPVREPHAPRP